MQAANFQKFLNDNFSDHELIKLVSEVVANYERDGCDSNNKELFSKLDKMLKEKGFAEIFDAADNKFAQPEPRTVFNRTLSLDRPGSPTPSNVTKDKTSADGCLTEIIKSILSNRFNINNKLELFKEKTSFQLDPNLKITEALDFGSHPLIPSYIMKSKIRGVFFYVNNIHFGGSAEPRDGATKDRDNLITLFREMNFSVFYFEDLTRDEFTNKICLLLLELKLLKTADSFVCCIQTHGDRKGNLSMMQFSDGTELSTEHVVSYFSNSSCPSLANKPKVFFFPFCRGKISDQRLKVMKTQTDSASNSPMPSYNDILICYATIPGYQAHRDTELGSWYVQELCKVFAEHAHDTHLEDMLKIVGAKTMLMTDRQGEGFVQVASTENRGFNKLLFFNPKL